MLNPLLTKRDYYINKMSMFLKQSYGMTELTDMMVNLLNNVDDTIDGFFRVLDIFNDNYLSMLNSYDNSKFDFLDNLAKIVGTSRTLKLLVKRKYLSLATDTYNKKTVYYKLATAQRKTEVTGVERYYELNTNLSNIRFQSIPSNANKDILKLNVYGLENDSIIYYENSTSEQEEIPIENVSAYIYADMDENGYIYKCKETGSYNFGKYIDFGSELSSRNITINYSSSEYSIKDIFKETDDIKSVPYKVYFYTTKMDLEEEDYVPNVYYTISEKEEYEIITLTNSELLKAIKLKIVKDNFDGTLESLTSIYKNINFPVYIYTDSENNVSVYLDVSESNKANNEITSNIGKIFRFSDYFSESVGVSYTKLLTSSIDGIFILAYSEEEERFNSKISGYISEEEIELYAILG